MPDKPEASERRTSIRVKVAYPGTVTQFDENGRPYGERPIKSVDVSVGGVKLKSSFPADSGGEVDVTLALGNEVVAFRGRVVHVSPSEDRGFEMGISIEGIGNEDRAALTKFVIQRLQSDGV
jgi:hypothetical protein